MLARRCAGKRYGPVRIVRKRTYRPEAYEASVTTHPTLTSWRTAPHPQPHTLSPTLAPSVVRDHTQVEVHRISERLEVNTQSASILGSFSVTYFKADRSSIVVNYCISRNRHVYRAYWNTQIHWQLATFFGAYSARQPAKQASRAAPSLARVVGLKVGQPGVVRLELSSKSAASFRPLGRKAADRPARLLPTATIAGTR